jgi:hypothetical protein
LGVNKGLVFPRGQEAGHVKKKGRDENKLSREVYLSEASETLMRGISSCSLSLEVCSINFLSLSSDIFFLAKLRRFLREDFSGVFEEGGGKRM